MVMVFDPVFDASQPIKRLKANKTDNMHIYILFIIPRIISRKMFYKKRVRVLL